MIYNDTESARIYSAITPSDVTLFANPTRGIYIGGAGTIVAVPLLPSPQGNGGFVTGTPVTFTNCQAGTYLPIRAIRINATGTTATNLVALL